MAELPRLSSGFQARYRLIRELGEGGMGRVFEAMQINLNRRVALKLLKAEIFGDVESRRRFVSEGKLLGKIAHANVVALFDADFDDRLPYLVMEFVDGPTLGQVVRERKGLPLADAIAVGAGILDGLGHMHQHGILHRDLKAENVLLQAGSRPMLADFGLARLEGSGRLTADGTVMGTPMYMSPEQMRGSEGGKASDIYAFGILLFHMLTGSYPIPSSSGWKSLTLKMEINRGTVAKQLRGLPPSIVDVVARCLAVHADQRYESTDELLGALGVPATSSKGLPIPAKKPAAPSRRTPPSLHWSIRVLIAGALALAVAAAGLRWRGRQPAATPIGAELIGQPVVEGLPGGSRVRWRTRSPQPSLVQTNGQIHGSRDPVVDHLVDVRPVSWSKPPPASILETDDRPGTSIRLVAQPISVRPETIRSGTLLSFAAELPETAPLILEIRGTGTNAARTQLPPARTHSTSLTLPDAEHDYELTIASPGALLLPARWLPVPLPAPRRELLSLFDSIRSLAMPDRLSTVMRDFLDTKADRDVIRRQVEALHARLAVRDRLRSARGAIGWAMAPGLPGGRPLAAALLAGVEQARQLDQLSRAAGVPLDTGLDGLLGPRWAFHVGRPPPHTRTAVFLPKLPIKITGALTAGIKSYFFNETLPTEADADFTLPEGFSARQAWLTLEIRSAVPHGYAILDLAPTPDAALSLSLPLDAVDRTAPKTPITQSLDPAFLVGGPNRIRLRFATLPGSVATTLVVMSLTVSWL